MNDLHAIVIPQLNVNDDTVTLVEWSVPHGTFVDSQTPISVVETSKAANELCAEHSGILYHLITPVRKVKVGDEIGLIGPSVAAIERFLAERAASAAAWTATAPMPERTASSVTPRARRLMELHGVTETEILAAGIQGAIKEKDVMTFLAARDTYKQAISPDPASDALPSAIARLVTDEGALSRHEETVADVLTASCHSALTTTAELDVDCAAINRALDSMRESGRMITLQHCLIGSTARALRKYPRFRSIYRNRSVFCYRDCAIGFVVKSLSGMLYTPVVRSADALPLNEIARVCMALTMKINRGTIQPEDLTGGCFTVSHIASPALGSFRALPNQFQSAVLAVASERPVLRLIDGQPAQTTVCTMTLSYDHALCDGMMAAEFLNTIVYELNAIAHD